MKWILTSFWLFLQFSELQTAFNGSILCHKKYVRDDLPSADGKQNFTEKTIFFIETSCNRKLNSRQACSIESAAKANPKWQIIVLFAGPLPSRSQTSKPMSLLKKYKNINFFRIHFSKYIRGTPLKRKFATGFLNKSKWRVHHTADVLRVITLYKWGGVYVDLDVIIVKSFDGLTNNWVAKEAPNVMAAGFLAISKDKIGRQFSKAAMRYYGLFSFFLLYSL